MDTRPRRSATTLSLFQLTDQYPTEDHAIQYFERLRWSGTPTCAKCEQAHKITPQKKRGTYWCGACRAYFTVFTNTPMENTRIAIRKWILAAYFLLTDRKGIASVELGKKLRIKQQHAWYLLHRLRTACEPSPDQLSGVIEVDETFVGGKARNLHSKKRRGRKTGWDGKQPVLGLRQRGGKVVARCIQGTDRFTLTSEVQKSVQKHSLVYTDNHSGYDPLPSQGYVHESLNHTANEYVRGEAHTNSIESVWAVLKRGLKGTYHHVSVKHLNRYVNEFTFRLNEGNCQVDTADRMAALFRAMIGKRITYKELIGKT